VIDRLPDLSKRTLACHRDSFGGARFRDNLKFPPRSDRNFGKRRVASNTPSISRSESRGAEHRDLLSVPPGRDAGLSEIPGTHGTISVSG